MSSTITASPEANSLPGQTERNPVKSKNSNSPLPAWKSYQKIVFRIAFIFFLIITIPLSSEWYKNLFGLDWLHLHYRDLYDVARFSPTLYKFDTPAYNLLGYIDWLEALGIGIIAGAVWTVIDQNKTKEYNNLYYWLRVIVRYRAGIGIIGFGFTKLLPTQMPYPSLGLLNTHFGDFTAQKIYWLSVGIVPWYQVFAGVVELTAGILLFFRKTTTLGAVLLLSALGDITYVNFAYDGGVHVYASYFVLFAVFLIIYDVAPIYNLIIRERFTTPFTYYPSFNHKWMKVARFSLKTVNVAVFLVLLFYLQFINWKYDPYKQPANKGLSALRGNYKVSEFKINDQVIPYAPLDSVRWKDVTFENWTTLTYNVNKPVKLDLSNGGGAPMRDINRTFELTGTAGGKRVFYYDADTVNKVLYLQDKFVEIRNRGRGVKKQKPAGLVKANFIPEQALAHIGNEDKRIAGIAQSTRRTRGIKEELQDKRKRNTMVLKYSANADGSRVVLEGKDENENKVSIVLDRISRKYLLTDSKLVAGKYE